MRNSKNHKRFPIFCELSNDRSPPSRGIQVSTTNPELLIHELSRYGEIQVLTLNSRSVTVLFQTLEEAVKAHSALSLSHRVFFSHEQARLPKGVSNPEDRKALPAFSRGACRSPLGALPQLSLRRAAKNSSNEALETEESTQDSPFATPRAEEKKKQLRKKPLDQSERQPYVVDLDLIWSGADHRTTVMVKNIPNKYTQKMLLQTIDKHLHGKYDFFYLPIDFKVKTTQNKCNVGYAFVNLTKAAVLPAFYCAFHGKKWERFNSDKVCQLAYARIQGKEGLMHHFESSSVMNHEDDKVKPIIKFP